MIAAAGRIDARRAAELRQVADQRLRQQAALIEILEQSRLLQNATPRGTVTRRTQPGTERFVITAEIRPRTAPEPASVSDSQAAIALAPAYAPPQAAPAVAEVAPVSSGAAAPPANAENLIFRPGGKPYVPPEMGGPKR